MKQALLFVITLLATRVYARFAVIADEDGYVNVRGRILIFRSIHNIPVGETPTGSGLTGGVSPPACEK